VKGCSVIPAHRRSSGSKPAKLPFEYPVVCLDGCCTAAGPSKGTSQKGLNNVAVTFADGTEGVVDAPMEVELKKRINRMRWCGSTASPRASGWRVGRPTGSLAPKVQEGSGHSPVDGVPRRKAGATRAGRSGARSRGDRARGPVLVGLCRGGRAVSGHAFAGPRASPSPCICPASGRWSRLPPPAPCPSRSGTPPRRRVTTLSRLPTLKPAAASPTDSRHDRGTTGADR
jgi:hypothetical protein